MSDFPARPAAGLFGSFVLSALTIGVWRSGQVQTGFGRVWLVLLAISTLCTLIATLGLLRLDCAHWQNRRLSALRWLAIGALVATAAPVVFSVGILLLATDLVIAWAAIGTDKACGRPLISRLVLGACGTVGAVVVLVIAAQ
jgi:hypothetical protein